MDKVFSVYILKINEFINHFDTIFIEKS